MPSRRPRISCAPSADLSQTPLCISVFFSVSRRVIAMISAIASSTTERVLENGALKTATPCVVAAARSIWSVPMQKAPIATRLSAASSTRAVTWVFDRMPSR
jgi:hypothetical protein